MNKFKRDGYSTIEPYSLVTLQQEEIQAQLQALKQRLAVTLAAENSSSADQLLIGAALLLLLDKIKDTRCNNLLKSPFWQEIRGRLWVSLYLESKTNSRR